MDEKWKFLLIINRDTSDNLYWHLVETEKPSPPPRPPSQWQAHNAMERLGRASMGAHKEKGMQTQACMNGAQMNYSFLSLFNSPSLMHPRGPIYSP